MDINKYFAEKIKEERLKSSLSQEKLALLADVDRTYLNDIERGTRNVSLAVAYKLTTALNIQFTNLFKELK